MDNADVIIIKNENEEKDVIIKEKPKLLLQEMIITPKKDKLKDFKKAMGLL